VKVLEFRRIGINDRYDELYNDGFAWSRVYEYPLVLDVLEKIHKEDHLIHNSSWGFAGVHVTFKEQLEAKFGKVENSDIKTSKLPNTFVYDITKLEPSLKNKYDILINVSTLEEVRGTSHVQIFKNLLDQVKEGGHIVCTFDLPGLQLEEFEKYLGCSLAAPNGEVLNGHTSKLKNAKYGRLNCGYLWVQK
jgi:hypothetical protein